MWQIDIVFVSILNRIWTNTQTKADIAFLNRIFHRQARQDPTFPYLFYRNKDVEEHDKKMLCVVQTTSYTLISIYKLTNNIWKKMHLSSTIELKNNMLVEMVGSNYAIDNSLVNVQKGFSNVVQNNHLILYGSNSRTQQLEMHIEPTCNNCMCEMWCATRRLLKEFMYKNQLMIHHQFLVQVVYAWTMCKT